MRLVILESPFAGKGDTPADIAQDAYRKLKYARRCVRDSLLRGEAPIASHLLYTQPDILRDWVPEERAHGIAAGLAWRSVADASVVYCDLGVSEGMRQGIEAARASGLVVEERYVGEFEK